MFSYHVHKNPPYNFSIIQLLFCIKLYERYIPDRVCILPYFSVNCKYVAL